MNDATTTAQREPMRTLLPADHETRALYFLLNSLVVPRPIAWISTRSADGTRNLAPHSYFTVAASDPPSVAFTSIGDKDTITNVRATREFVVHVADHALVDGVAPRRGRAGKLQHQLIRLLGRFDADSGGRKRL
jgi:flavin reductase (DIM6/NTAB) family NADH-FMN oxidoreductase RutF